ncbi:MAG: MFS transporter [Gracilibacteraceae bacterium]|jgi:AAHS family benzoate transporter-like MFS transporter|nr:MFS transporter [Gracilibacteraceae bacterium]
MNISKQDQAEYGIEEKLERRHIIIFVICLIIVTGEGYNLFLYGAVLPMLSDDWSLNSSQAGLIGSASLVGMAAGSVFLGQIADRLGKKKALFLSVLLYSLFTLLCGLAPGILTFSLCRFICGIGIGGALPCVTALIADTAPPNLRSAMVSLVLCGMQIGGLLGPLASMVTAENFGWRAVLWLGGLTLLLLPFIYKYLPDPNGVSMKKNVRRGGIKILTIGGKKNFALFCLAYFMNLLIMYGLGTWLAVLMIRSGVSVAASMTAMIFLNAGCLAGTVFFAVIISKWKQLRYLIIILFIVAAIALITLGYQHHYIMLLLIVSIVGACTYGNQNLVNAFVSQYYPAEIRSGALGLCNGAGRLGAIFGTVFWGVLLESPLSLPVIFFIFAVSALLAGAAFLMVAEG